MSPLESPVSISSEDIGRMLSLIARDTTVETSTLRDYITHRFEDVMNFIEGRPDLCKLVAMGTMADNPQLLSEALRKIFQKSSNHTADGEVVEDELGIIGTELQGMYSNQWFHVEKVFDFQETAVKFIDALSNFYDSSEDQEDEIGFGDLLEEDDEDGGEVGRMLDMDDMNNLKIIVSAVQTYLDYIEARRDHIKSTKDERNIFNKEMQSGRIFHIRTIVDALRAILFESYLCECINRRSFKYTDDTLRKLIVQWDKYRMEVHFEL